jgi:hypothetical protein
MMKLLGLLVVSFLILVAVVTVVLLFVVRLMSGIGMKPDTKSKNGSGVAEESYRD